MADERNPRDVDAKSFYEKAQKVLADVEAGVGRVEAAARAISRGPTVGEGVATGRPIEAIRTETGAIEARTAATRQGMRAQLDYLRTLERIGQRAQRIIPRDPLVAQSIAAREARTAAQERARALGSIQGRPAEQGILVSPAARGAYTGGRVLAELQAQEAALRTSQAEAEAMARAQERAAEAARRSVASQELAARQAGIAARAAAQQAAEEASISRFQLQRAAIAGTGRVPAPSQPVTQQTLYELEQNRRAIAAQARQPGGPPGFGGLRTTTVGPDITGPQGLNYKRFATAADELGRGRRIQQMTDDLSRLGAVQAQASQQMRRHGALTVEFLQALARGETTLAEFRFQLGATIAKFGGWTLAASLVYGAVDAFHQLATGAKETQNAVNLIERVTSGVDRGATARGIRDLAQQFNLPIADVGQVAYKFAQVFHDVPQALEASKAALYAVKVGELDAADAGRLLISMQQGLHVSSGQLVNIFDQVNQAQNRYGASIQDVLAGTAKASGSFRAAGGDITQLIALITTIQRTSGRSGQQIGTALQRVPGLVTRDVNQQILRSFGLDPTQPLEALFNQAIAIAPRLGRQARLRLAQGLSTPQLAPTIVPVLQNAALYNRVVGDISPEKAKGSAQRELQKQLHSVDEQIHRVGVSLQALGSALRDSGAFTSFGLMLRLLNETLSTAVRLVNAFDELPGVLREPVAMFLQLYLVAKFLRSTRIGAAVADFLPQSIGRRLGPGAGRRAQLEEVIALRQTETTQAGLYESTSNRAAQAKAQAVENEQLSRKLTAEADNLKLQAEVNAGTARGATLQQQENDIRARALAAQGEATELQQRSLILEQQQAVQEEQLVATRARITALQKGEVEASVAFAAAQKGKQTPARDTAREAAQKDLAAAGVTEAGAMEAEAAAAQVAAAETAATTGRMRTAAEKAKTAGSKFKASLLAGTSAMRLFNAALITYLVAETFIDAAKQANEKLDEAAKTNAGAAHTLDQLRSKARDQYKAPGVGAKLADAAATSVESLVNNILHPANFLHPDNQLQTQNAVARAQQEAQRNLNQAVLRARAHTIQSPFRTVGLTYGEIQRFFEKDVQDLHSGVTTKQQFENSYRKLVASAKVSAEVLTGGAGPGAEIANLMRVHNQIIGPTAANPFAQFEQSGPTADAAFMQLLQQQQKLGVRRGRSLGTITRGGIFDIYRYGGSSNQKVIEQLLNEQSAFNDGIASVQDDLAKAVARANTPGQVSAAYTKALGQLDKVRPQIRQTLRDLQTRMGGTRKTLRDLEGEFSRQDLGGSADLPHGAAPGQQVHDPLYQRIEGLRARYKTQQAAYKRARAVAQGREHALTDLERQIRDEAFAADLQRYSLYAEYHKSESSDPSEQIAIDLHYQHMAVQDALERYGRHSQQYIEQITKQNQLERQQEDQRRQSIQTHAAYLASTITTAGTGGDIARQRQILAGQYKQLAYDQRIGAGKDQIEQDKTAINDSIRQINESRKQSIDEQRQNARALRDARSEYLQSQTEDPVKQDRIGLRTDIADLKGLKGAERYQQMAKINQDKIKLRDDIAQQDIQAVEHEHNIGRLSDQAYIDALKKILRTVKMGKQARQQLEEQIYSATHDAAQGDLELNVPNIKLPNIQQIRKSIIGAMGLTREQRGITVNHQSQVNVKVEKGADEATVYGAIDQAINGGVRSAARSAGVL